MRPTPYRTFYFLALFLSTMPVAASTQDVRVLPKNLEVQSSDVSLNSYRFQSAIRRDQSLGTLATAHSTIGEQVLTFGFGAKSEEATFFLLGSLYAEAAAYLHSGDLAAAEKRLAAIEKECIRLQVPNSLYAYVSKVRNLLATQRYNAEVIGDFLALLQPFLEDYAASQGPEKRTLFRAGAWLVDLSLAAAADDKHLLSQVHTLQYFTEEMKRLQAPQGVIDAFTELTDIAAKAELSDQDVKQVLKLVSKIQTILG